MRFEKFRHLRENTGKSTVDHLEFEVDAYYYPNGRRRGSAEFVVNVYDGNGAGVSVVATGFHVSADVYPDDDPDYGDGGLTFDESAVSVRGVEWELENFNGRAISATRAMAILGVDNEGYERVLSKAYDMLVKAAIEDIEDKISSHQYVESRRPARANRARLYEDTGKSTVDGLQVEVVEYSYSPDNRYPSYVSVNVGDKVWLAFEDFQVSSGVGYHAGEYTIIHEPVVEDLIDPSFEDADDHPLSKQEVLDILGLDEKGYRKLMYRVEDVVTEYAVKEIEDNLTEYGDANAASGYWKR